MKTHYLLLAACLVAVGCNEPGPIDGVQVLSPGRPMRLAYRHEWQASGVSVEEERYETYEVGPDTATQPSIVIKRIETPHEGVDWGDGELSMHVTAMPGSDDVRATMVVQRLEVGHVFKMAGEDKMEESDVFVRGSSTAVASPQEDSIAPICAEFVAVIDQAGRVVSVDIDVEGKDWRARKKELTKDLKDMSGDGVVWWQVPRIFLEDAMAYLPPQGTQPGRSWKVLRERVLPYQAYGFYMFTNGCGSSREESTCTLRTVRTGLRGKIAVIAIRGKRFPQFPEPSMPERVKFIKLTGEMEVNLTTGAVEKLRLESIPRWSDPEDAEQVNLKLVHVLSLKPA